MYLITMKKGIVLNNSVKTTIFFVIKSNPCSFYCIMRLNVLRSNNYVMIYKCHKKLCFEYKDFNDIMQVFYKIYFSMQTFSYQIPTYCIFTLVPKGLYYQVLFYPFED